MTQNSSISRLKDLQIRKKSAYRIAKITSLSFCLVFAMSGPATASTEMAIDQENNIPLDPRDGVLLTEEEVRELESLPRPDSAPLADVVNNLSVKSNRINTPACGTRTDFYRWKMPEGGTICFANPGSMTYAVSTSLKKICPGANLGRTYYLFNGTHYWSQWRGPEINHNNCYNFTEPVKALGVTISK